MAQENVLKSKTYDNADKIARMSKEERRAYFNKLYGLELTEEDMKKEEK